ncbi:MAG: hypothetical protein H0W58_07485 [Acidobacteria bacterium]|jgi:hypothetical protein|nr:hypothetical protein [Acidobacteriota bacterium]
MSLINRKSQTLVAPCCAAMLLDLDESTLRKGKAGTESLTQVRRGSGKRQRVSFILEEIILLKTEWIEAARKPQARLRLVSNR